MARFAYTPDSAMDEFPDDDCREWLDGCVTRIEKIRATIKVLFFEENAHWDSSGRPRIRAVEVMSNLENVTFEEIWRAVPGYTRWVAEAWMLGKEKPVSFSVH
jgi:hypothetical protein